MTRVGHTLKDKGHYGRKAVGYAVLVLLFLPIVLCEGGRWVGENVLYPATSKLHRWMRPCLYAKRERCRCYEYDGGPYGGAIGDHLCSSGCSIHGPCSCQGPS